MMTNFFSPIKLECSILQKQERGQWGEGGDFPQPSRTAPGPPRPLYNGYRVIPGGKNAGAWL